MVHHIRESTNDARLQDYVYQNVTLEANTQYTVSVYSSAWNSSYETPVILTID